MASKKYPTGKFGALTTNRFRNYGEKSVKQYFTSLVKHTVRPNLPVVFQTNSLMFFEGAVSFLSNADIIFLVPSTKDYSTSDICDLVDGLEQL